MIKSKRFGPGRMSHRDSPPTQRGSLPLPFLGKAVPMDITHTTLTGTEATPILLKMEFFCFYKYFFKKLNPYIDKSTFLELNQANFHGGKQQRKDNAP